MKNKTINYSWPAIMSDFSQDNENENFSRGKLKVFFKGETEDRRYFSDEFAEKIVKTLPYTPVVSNYDEEKEDFVGHASEQQIFGIVDPCCEPVFQECEDGKTWCIVDVVLYTERPDKVGKFAQKIIGQPHSLELDPHSVEYVINYDEKKHFKNIEFTAGQFVGVSVLGKNQKPAFTGSAFFSCNENFESKMKILKDYCEHRTDDQSQNGGEKMNLKEFMELSWGDISTKVEAAIQKEYENDAYCYLVDMYDDSAIMRFWYYMEQGAKLMRVKYSVSEEGMVSLGDVNEVVVSYVDVPSAPIVEIDMQQVEETFAQTTEDVIEVESEPEVVEPEQETVEVEETFETTTTEDVVEEVIEETTTDVVENPDVVEETNIEVEETFETTTTIEDVIVDEPASGDTATQVTDVEITPTTMEASVEDEQNSTSQETNTSSTAFTESEREEFEALKREKKLGLVNSYKDSLSDEDYDNFVANLDSFDIKDLELELLKKYKSNQQTQKPIRAFAFAPTTINANNNESTLDAFVRKNKR